MTKICRADNLIIEYNYKNSEEDEDGTSHYIGKCAPIKIVNDVDNELIHYQTDPIDFGVNEEERIYRYATFKYSEFIDLLFKEL